MHTAPDTFAHLKQVSLSCSPLEIQGCGAVRCLFDPKARVTGMRRTSARSLTVSPSARVQLVLVAPGDRNSWGGGGGQHPEARCPQRVGL